MAFNRGNPDNSKSTLFKQLTRLLSGPITNYRRQNPRQLKRRQLDKYRFRSASGQPFKKSMILTQTKLNTTIPGMVGFNRQLSSWRGISQTPSVNQMYRSLLKG